MSNFDDLIQSEMEAVLLGDGSEEITWTPDYGNGTPTTIRASIRVITGEAQSVNDGTEIVHNAELYVDSGNYQLGDVFTFRGKDWICDGPSVADIDGSMLVKATCQESIEKSRDGYRRTV